VQARRQELLGGVHQALTTGGEVAIPPARRVRFRAGSRWHTICFGSSSMRTTLSLIVIGLMGCQGGGGINNPGDEMIQSSQARLSAGAVPAADVAQQSLSNTTFAFDLYAQLAKTPGNLFFSPYSISSALAMAWAGAAGDTATAMANTLAFTMDAGRVHPAFNALDAALASRAQNGTSEGGGPFQLSVANALWGEKGLPYQPQFLDVLKENYGAGVRIEDFLDSPEPARADINGWVSQNTGGKIPMLLGQGTITNDTRVVLTNAVYFNGAWANPFDPMFTESAPFHLLGGTTTMVPEMHEALQTVYASGSGWQAVELPYSNQALSLTVILPDDGQLAAVEAQLSAAFLDGLTSAERPAQVTLGLPRFNAQTQASLRDPLTALGMGQAFTKDSADFSALDGEKDLFISDVIHQATVSVDEKGTEAAAATAVILTGEAIAIQQVTLTVDRPFLLALRDRPTGAVLFAGRVVTP
jgi:serpin B